MDRILLVGPVSPPIHGQSLAFTRFVESIEGDNGIVINTNLEDKSKIGKMIYTCKTFIAIFRRTLFTKYDVVYFTCSRSFSGSIKDILLINLASLKKVRIINHLHGSDFDEFLHSSPNWYKKVLFYSYKKVDISIVLLDSMKAQFKDFRNLKVEVVPNFYDRILDIKLAEKEKNTINLVYLSNIIKSKGIFELVEAFKALSKKYDDLYLNIAGGFMADEYMSIGEVKKKFFISIESHDKINYIGKIFGNNKVKLLQKSDIFVLPSYYKSEAFPISIIEAMVCENAIITTSYKYLPDIVSKENGILVAPSSVESLADGIQSLLKDRVRLRKIQRYNREEAKDKYSLDNYIKNLNKLVMKNQ